MKKVIMVSPEYFDVEYAINAYMRSPTGELNKIDRDKAGSQWSKLKNIYFELGFDVHIIEGVRGLPDMVFSANQSFPFWDFKKNKPAVILSNMRSDFRKKEVIYFRKFYEDMGYELHHLDPKLSFEGNGDALIRPNSKEIYGGFGFRTDKNVYEELQRKTGYEIFLLELTNEYFYHLDTCLSFLNEDTVAIVKEAFNDDSLKLIDLKFKNVIHIDFEEAKNNFAGNCHSPDGKHVILHQGSTKFTKELASRGFQVIEINTSEFMKSGGSVFCMKMMCY